MLEPINEEEKSIKHTKKDIVNNLSEKHLHDICEQYVHAEL